MGIMHCVVPQLARTLIKDRQMARDELVRMLEPLQTRENCLMTLVFDGRGGKSVINQHRGNDNYSIIFHLPLRVRME